MCSIKNKKSRLCVICDTPLFGRSDKRFCSVKCKNNYHAEIRRTTNAFAKDTFKQLLRNHRILSELIGPEKKDFEINLMSLKRKGFDPQSITGFKLRSAEIVFSLFNFSWTFTAGQTIAVSFHENQSPVSPYLFKRLERFGPFETELLNEKSAIT